MNFKITTKTIPMPTIPLTSTPVSTKVTSMPVIIKIITTEHHKDHMHIVDHNYPHLFQEHRAVL